MAEYSEDDVKEMIENIDATGEANPKGQEGGRAEAETQIQQLIFDGPDSLLKHQLEYTANGKTVKEDIQTILKRASQGYNYAQLSHELKERQRLVDQQAQEATGINEKWSKFEKYAKENPKWYDHWTRAWEQRDQLSAGGAESQLRAQGFDDSQITAILEQKLEPIREFITKQQAEKDQLQLREQDQALDQEIKETKAAFPSVDFDKSDPETGKTLMWQVLEFANQRGMGFQDAFKVFYHDKLLASQMEEKKAEWAKEQEAARKKGIIGNMPTSKKDPLQPDFSKSTWDQITEYAGKQMGLLG
jgi:hypothetical protein